MSNNNKIPSIKIPSQTKENSSVLDLDQTIKDQIEQIAIVQNKGIKNVDCTQIENVLAMIDSLIVECNATQNFHFNRNENIIELLYRYQRLSLEYETYKIEQKMVKVEEDSKKLEERQEKFAKESHNLVYTILSFIASFSIVSAAVSAIGKIDDVKYICLFILFILFIIITTLIGLDNFYREEKSKKHLLKNNYFLWKLLLIMIIIFVVIIFIGDIWNKNKNEIMTNIENKVTEYLIDEQNKKEP